VHSQYQLTLAAQAIETAEPASRAILEAALAQMGFVPNMYARMANSPALLSAYTSGYRCFRESSGLTAIQQEVVLLAISVENRCDYCVAAHSFVADAMAMVPVEVTNAVRAGGAVGDPSLAALASFTRLMVAKRGLPSTADVRSFLQAGYEERHILAIITAIGVKTMSNYSNHLFHTPLDPVFSGRVWSDSRASHDDRPADETRGA
jgi:uncharacterized peroxidase-related enzyme